jgi:AcrR family transcriptional regulator
LIATAAGINVATLYQYFPNKQSILVTLFDRLAIQPDKARQGFFPAWDGRTSDWRGALEQAVAVAFARRRNLHGVVQLRRAMLTDPKLRAMDGRFGRAASGRLARDLATATGMPRSQALTVARSCLDVVDVQLDTWIVETSAGAAIIRETQSLLSRYLQPYFEKRVRRPAKRR